MSSVGSETLERHTMTVVATIITGLLGWVGYTSQMTAVGVARLEVQITGVNANAVRLQYLETRIQSLERGAPRQ